jgi:hypothetical protein
MNAVLKLVPQTEQAPSQIDALAMLNTQIKELTAKAAVLKDSIANEYGEGKHRGDTYGVTVTLCKTTAVDYKSLIADMGISDDVVAKYTKHGASIRVTSTN